LDIETEARDYIKAFGVRLHPRVDHEFKYLVAMLKIIDELRDGSAVAKTDGETPT